MGTAGWIVLSLLGLGVVGAAAYLVVKSRQASAAATATPSQSTTGSTLSGVGQLLAGLGSGIGSVMDNWGDSGGGYGASDGYQPTFTGSEDYGWG